MSIARLDTGFNIQVEFPIAPFHRRAMAWVIDRLLIVIYLFLGYRLLHSLFSGNWEVRHPVISLLFWLPVLLYSLIMEISMNGQSVGKKLMSIKVITLEGGQPTLSQYIIRWLFRSVDLLWWGWQIHPALILLIFGGIICVIVTPYSQRIGDLVAGTILIDLKAKTSWQDTIFMQIEESYKPHFPEIMKLSDRDINTVKQIFTSVKKNNDLRYAATIAAKIQGALDIKTDMDAITFLETILKDYNFYTGK
jgi:uncharacterized RDD family membrane protein YckC